MSITSILNGNKFDSLKEYIRTKAPKKDAFLSNTRYPAFSTDIPIQVVGLTQSTQETAQVGKVADYAFCLEILRYVKKQKLINYQNFFGFINSAYRFIVQSDPEHSEIIEHYYPKLQSGCLLYVMGNDIEISKVVEYSYQLHKIENFHRVPREDRDVFWETFLQPCEESVVRDVIRLVEIFRKCFFEDGIIKEKSTVVLHPRFGTHTSPVGIADLYADGILYDFKSSKRNGYNWKDVGQVYGYYILHRLSQKYDNNAVLAQSVPIKKVVGIAVYYSRYGDIETCDLKGCNSVLSSKEIEYLAKMMNHHRREFENRHIEEMKKVFASQEWRKLAFSKESKDVPIYTPENVGYAVGDTIYNPSQGKGEVLKFIEKDGHWYVVLSFESGQVLRGDINKIILLNWNSLDNNKNLQDTTDYFLL